MLCKAAEIPDTDISLMCKQRVNILYKGYFIQDLDDEQPLSSYCTLQPLAATCSQ